MAEAVNADPAVGASRLGGQPDLAEGDEWPRIGSNPLAFILQLSLPDVSTISGAEGLPTSGLLSFFYDAVGHPWGHDPSHKGGWQVRYTTSDVRLRRLDPPPAVPMSARYPMFQLAPMPELAPAPAESADVEVLGLTRSQVDRYQDVLGEVLADDVRPHHRLGGHPDPIQGNMQLEAHLVANGMPLEPVMGGVINSGHFAREAVEWRMLLQVDSDDQAHMEWADDGRLYYWIRRQDLRAQRFDRAWVILQSY